MEKDAQSKLPFNDTINKLNADLCNLKIKQKEINNMIQKLHTDNYIQNLCTNYNELVYKYNLLLDQYNYRSEYIKQLNEELTRSREESMKYYKIAFELQLGNTIIEKNDNLLMKNFINYNNKER